MADAYGRQPAAAHVLRWIARVILVAWSLLWLYYYASLAAEAYPAGGFNAALIPLLVLAAIICALVIAWLLELLGALIFIAAAVLAFLQWEQPHWFSLATICLPMLAAGVLLIIAWAVARFGAVARITDIAPPDAQEPRDESRFRDPGW